jgi:hypothetical protein
MPRNDDSVLREILDEIRRWRHDTKHQYHEIMEAIQTFATRVNAAFDALSTSVEGIADDVLFLKEEIAKLQAAPGVLTPEDQASLDALEARVAGLGTKIAELDSATSRPPVVGG